MSASVGRNSAIMAMGTLASRVTGQVRTILLAAAVGTTGIAANAYQTGSTIPQVLFTILSGGVFNAVLVPQIVRSLKQKDAEDQLNKLITLSVVILAAVTGIMMACSTLLTSLYLDSSWNAAQRSLANSFTLWCMPQIFFYGLYTVLGQVLAAKNRFGAYAWSSTGANVISCIGFIVFIALYGNASHQSLDFWTTDKIALLAGAWTLGVAFQALVLFIPLITSGYRWRPRLGVRGIGLRSMSSVAVWSLGIVLINQLVGIVTSRVTNGAPLQGGDPYGIAGNSTYQNAFTLFILPYSLFAVSIATAMFPRMSEYIADGDYASARKELSSTLCNLTLIIAFFTVAYLVEPVQITAALLPSVQPSEVNLMRVPLMVLCLANVPTSAILVLERTFYAFKDGRTPFLYTVVQNLVQVVIVVCGITMFPPRDWVTVVCCALAMNNILTLPFIYYLVHRHFPQGLDDRRIARTAAHTVTAALIAIAAGALVNGLFHAIGWDVLGIESMGRRWITALVQALIITAASGGAYYGVLSALHTPEIAIVRGMVQRMLSKVLRRPIGQGTQDSAVREPQGQPGQPTPQADAQGFEEDRFAGPSGSGSEASGSRTRTAPRSASSSNARSASAAVAEASAPRPHKPRVISSALPSPFVSDDTAAGLDIIQDLHDTDVSRPSAQPTQFPPRKRKQHHSASATALQANPADSQPQANHPAPPSHHVSHPGIDEFGRAPIWAMRETAQASLAHHASAHPAPPAPPAPASAQAPAQAGEPAEETAAYAAPPTARHTPAQPAAPVASPTPAASYFPRAAGPADTESVELHKILTRAPQAAANNRLTVPNLDVPLAQAPQPLPYRLDDVARHAATAVHTKDSPVAESGTALPAHPSASAHDAPATGTTDRDASAAA